MSQKVDVKLPCESDNYDWEKQFDRPLLHKRIVPKMSNKPTRRQYGDEQGLTKEDEDMNIHRKDQVEMVEKAKEADVVDNLVQGFVDAEQEAKELLDLIGKYKQAAVACAEILGAEGKPILDKIWEQLSNQIGEILPRVGY